MSDPSEHRPTVVFLHGLARTHRSLSGLRRAVERAGYATWAASYPSRRVRVRDAADEIARRLREELPERPLVGVTHSLGGILVRHMADALPWKGLVMIAPPNHGSSVARILRGNPVFQWFYGPAGEEVCASDAWPAPPKPFAVIAGTRAVSLGNPTSLATRALGWLGPDVPSDGTVTVEETRLSGMCDFATVDASHTWIMDHPDTRRRVLRFLATGRL